MSRSRRPTADKSSVRAKVEHVFGVIKRVFGFQKVCYRGLAKNLHRLEVTAALANLFLVKRRLLAIVGKVSVKFGKRARK